MSARNHGPDHRRGLPGGGGSGHQPLPPGELGEGPPWPFVDELHAPSRARAIARDLLIGAIGGAGLILVGWAIARVGQIAGLWGMKRTVLHERIPDFLSGARSLDMLGFSAQQGWRTAGAIDRGLRAASPSMVVSVCELLADRGKLEVRCGEAGWVWYRIRRGR